MVVLNKIYTRTGDEGTTALGTGARVPKTDPRIEAYGTVDELNAVLGMAALHLEAPLVEMVSRIQNDLFDLGADLCVPPAVGEDEGDNPPLRVISDQVVRLENEIDALNGDLAPLDSFVLPGGTPASAYLHLARTVSRRAERGIIALADTGDNRVGAPALHYINRLSDFFFVAARYANDKGARDVKWVPGANR